MRDMMGLMKQAQDMQKKMAEMQAQLDTLEFEGSAGGGLVTVVMTAKNVLKSVKIDPSLMVAGEQEILEDPAIYPDAELMKRLWTAKVIDRAADRARVRAWSNMKTGQ